MQSALPSWLRLDDGAVELAQRVPAKLDALPCLDRAERVRQIDGWEIRNFAGRYGFSRFGLQNESPIIIE